MKKSKKSNTTKNSSPRLTKSAQTHRIPWLSLIKAYLPAITWAAVIFVLSSSQTLPSLATPNYDFFLKKIAHMTVYGVLYWLFLYGTNQIFPPSKIKTRFFLPIILCLLYAISDEIHQTFVPGRFGTLRDIGYDMLGMWAVLLWQWNYIQLQPDQTQK